MNPAHVFLISLAVLAIFWLGVYCGGDGSCESVDAYLCIIAILLNLAAAGFLVVGLWNLVAQAL